MGDLIFKLLRSRGRIWISCWKLFLSLASWVMTYIMKMYCSWCITILGYTCQIRKFGKFINIPSNTKFFRRSWLREPSYFFLIIIWEQLLLPIKVICKDFVDISYENVTLGILEDSIWLQLIYFLTIIAFCLINIFFGLMGTTRGC